MARGRTFTREFKLEVVRQVEQGERRPAQVCREHGLADGVLWRWRREYAILNLSRSWVYARAPVPAPEAGAVALRDAIERIVLDFPGYGYRRVTHQLRRDGWELSRHIDADLTLAALERAITHRRPAPGLIHHSDHGVQYASTRYTARLEATGLQISMAAIGHVYENALAESFFATLKREEVYLHDYQSFAEAQANLTRFIDAVYNHKRLHSSLGYRPPSEFEALSVTARANDEFLEGREPPTLALVR